MEFKYKGVNIEISDSLIKEMGKHGLDAVEEVKKATEDLVEKVMEERNLIDKKQ